MRSVIFGLLCATVILISGCGKHEEPLYQEQFFTFGTLVDIEIYGVDKAVAQRAAAGISQQFQQFHRDWHAWHTSDLTRLNAALAMGHPAPVPPSLLPLLERSISLAAQSDQRFNPAIGNLIAAWGFAQDDAPSGPPPPLDIIQSLLTTHPSMADLHLQNGTLTTSNTNVRLDFGAIAKGYAVDIAIEMLSKQGIHNAIVNAGGNLKASGRHGERAWRIGIRNPRGPGVLASVETHGDEAVLTSGDYERYYEYQGQRYHHIIDPRSGAPARGLTSVTVIHPSATVADAASTALFVAGPQGWQKTAAAMGIRDVMVVDAAGHISMTPTMARRVHFEITPVPQVTLTP